VKYLLGLVVLFSASTHALTPDHAGSGAGIAEKNVTFAYANLHRYIGMCLASEVCRATPEEKAMLTAIVRELPNEGPADRQIVFASEKAKPGFFVIDGKLKIAKTGESVGSKIYVNEDLLYTKSPKGVARPLTLAGAVALLVHELGHHHGEKDHLKLDVLGGKVESLLHGHSQTIEMAPYNRDLFGLVIDFEEPRQFSQFLMGDKQNMYDLTRRLKEELSCAAMDPTWKLVGFRLYNLHWGRGYGTPTAPGEPTSKIWNQPVWGDLNLFCEWGEPGKFAEVVRWSLKLTAHYDTTSPFEIKLMPHFKIEQKECHVQPETCH